MEDTITHLIEKDAVFQHITDQYGIPVFPSRPEGFASMCRTILEQQVSLNSARASFYKIANTVVEFTPQNILLLQEHTFKECGISRQKTAYIRDLAQAVISGKVNFGSFSHKAPDEIRQELIQVKGIGNWTIDVYLMFSLQSPDILPLGDIGIQSAIKDLLGLQSVMEMEEYSRRWVPCRTTASFLLWHYYLKKRGREFPH